MSLDRHRYDKKKRSDGSKDSKKVKINLDDILSEWYKLKKNLKQLQEREDQIKKIVRVIMNNERSDKLKSDDYQVSKRTMNKTFLTKHDLPEELWNKYSKKKSIEALYLKRL